MNNSYIKTILLASCLTGIFFSLITFLLSALGVLSVGQQTLSKLLIAGLPFIIPALALWLYQFLNSRFPNNSLEKFSLLVSNILLGICVAMLFFGYQKWYTLITTFILLSLLIYIEYLNKLRFMYRFYRLFILLLILFYPVYLMVITHGFLKFNAEASLKLGIGGVSIEAFFYLMAMLLMAVYLFELFKHKISKSNG
ncbi:MULTISPECIES: lycopene cyclase domain-containing protein [Pedobacter]|uniref:Lycopene cyclase domain-containing protein n=1 Tax=Pedobacter heparinus (strain ATCC 13125 / DSM 2366 / CIP 104194 / JCM 7457 / NBRC 12017 / NCIMB 9290 / NRRL B-14731 / HIM 762-3) TaxID=485917 RepID=C6XU95_PEDHD|nr:MULTISPECIES: lycopene cyclase domain-containing protein [Pedobacter]ACU05888.1 hypothetical protein Phep_3697 [Pedobacter heparinus DSM 2366]MBB5438668.1 hypothetical protein [Pedobacter sp. AK017]